jgi:hypothetical protein
MYQQQVTEWNLPLPQNIHVLAYKHREKLHVEGLKEHLWWVDHMIDHHKSSKPEIYREIILYDENCMISAKNKYLLKGFVDGGFECNVYPRADGAKRRARVLIPRGYLHPGKRKH